MHPPWAPGDIFYSFDAWREGSSNTGQVPSSVSHPEETVTLDNPGSDSMLQKARCKGSFFQILDSVLFGYWGFVLVKGLEILQVSSSWESCVIYQKDVPPSPGIVSGLSQGQLSFCRWHCILFFSLLKGKGFAAVIVIFVIILTHQTKAPIVGMAKILIKISCIWKKKW